MKKVIAIMVVSLVSYSVISAGWFEKRKVQAQQAGRRLGQRMGIIEKTPLEQMQEGAQQMKKGLVTGWEQFKEEFPGQVEQFKEDVTVWGKTAAEKAKRKAREAQRYLEKQWKKAPWSR